MTGRLKASRTKQDNAFTTLSPIAAMQLSLPLSAIAELPLPNSDKSSEDKSNLCQSVIEIPKSSQTSDRDLTSKGKDCKPYWSDLCAVTNSRLLLPYETDFADSGLNYSSSWQHKTVDRSWFSQVLFTAKNPNLQRIFLPSFTSSLAECSPGETTARKSRKIRLFLNPEQKALLKQWFGVSRFVYNTTIKYLQEPGTKASWLSIKTEILHGLPDWAKSVPFQIKSIAIKDACFSVKAAKKGFGKDGQLRICKFRSRKDTKRFASSRTKISQHL